MTAKAGYHWEGRTQFHGIRLKIRNLDPRKTHTVVVKALVENASLDGRDVLSRAAGAEVTPEVIAQVRQALDDGDMVVATATRYVSREYEATIDLPIDRRLLPLLGKYFALEVSVAEGASRRMPVRFPRFRILQGIFGW